MRGGFALTRVSAGAQTPRVAFATLAMTSWLRLNSTLHKKALKFSLFTPKIHPKPINKAA